MSTEQSVDENLVEQTKQHIRSLVREIAQISKSDVPPLEFYDGVLQRIVKALAAVGGAIWTMSDTGQLTLEFEINLRATRLADSQEDQIRHTRLIRNVFTRGEGTLVSPNSGSGKVEDGGNPTEFLLVLGPLKTTNETVGVIEIFQRPGASSNTQQGYLTFLLQMCELAAEYLKSRKLQHFTDRQALWAQLEGFTRAVHKGLETQATAYTIANDGRRLIECDRVSVAIYNGRKCRIEAVSGQDMFDKRSNTIMALANLATAAVASGETVWYTGDTSMMAPQVEEAVQEYIDECHSKAVAIVPLKEPHDKTDPMANPRILGALIIEQIEDSRPRDGLQQRIDVVSEHSAIALANTVSHNELFMMPVWRSIGKSRWVIEARQLPYTITIGAVVLVALLVLCLWPADFDLNAKGVLQPRNRRDVHAPLDGDVVEIYVANGEKVIQGQPLLKIRNSDLDARVTDTKSKLEGARARLTAATMALNASPTTDRRLELEGTRKATQEELAGLEVQRKILEEQHASLTLKSPIEGEVVGWRIEANLANRPVGRGQTLLTVNEPNGPWQLEVRMPEEKMGFVHNATFPMRVSYVTHTNPGTYHDGTAREIHKVAGVQGEEGNIVLIDVDVNKDDVPDRRDGASVNAKVNCGRAPIGYVWFHSLVSFFQKLWFKIF